METSPCEFRDWAHLLPAEIVLVISNKVKSITDYVRFRAVCSPWRSASLPKPSHLPPQLPWLMIPFSPWDSRTDDGIRLFYDIFESKMRKLHLPETTGLLCSASYRGWLLLVATEGAEVFLLNPLTRARVNLPSFTTPVRHIRSDSSAPGYDASWVFKPHFGNFVITRVTFSSDLTDPNCLIMVFVERWWGRFCCRVGDPYWTEVSLRPSIAQTGDAAYYNGCFYLLSKGVMHITEFDKPEIPITCFLEDNLRDSNLFLLEGKSGLHVVAVCDTAVGDEEEPSQDDEHQASADIITEKGIKQTFELYQIYHDTNKKYAEEPPPGMFPIHLHSDLKKITYTSNTTIFCGEKHHFLAVCSDDWDSLDGDCMYIVHKEKPSPGKDMGGEYYNNYYSISFVKIGGTKCETVAYEIAGEPPIWPPAPAMWFQPSYV